MEKPNTDDKISKLSFAKMLLEYMDKLDTYEELRRVKHVLDSPYSKSTGVTFKQVNDLYKVLDNSEDIEMALDMHTSAGIEMTKENFRLIGRVVTSGKDGHEEINLDDQVLEVMWAVFDKDNSGGLSRKEFLKNMKRSVNFGVRKSKTDTGLWRLFESALECGKEKLFGK